MSNSTYRNWSGDCLAAQVTLENMESLARWAKGKLWQRNTENPHLKYETQPINEPTFKKEYFIRLEKDGEPYKALIGDWIVLRVGRSGKTYYDVYSNEDFADLYEGVNP